MWGICDVMITFWRVPIPNELVFQINETFECRSQKNFDVSLYYMQKLLMKFSWHIRMKKGHFLFLFSRFTKVRGSKRFWRRWERDTPFRWTGCIWHIESPFQGTRLQFTADRNFENSYMLRPAQPQSWHARCWLGRKYARAHLVWHELIFAAILHYLV